MSSWANRVASVALDSAIDGVDLDRVCQVVGEVDHHGQTQKEQGDRPTDSEPRKDLCPGTSLQADGKQTCRAVDEGREEDAEDNLSGTIPQEVPQQPRRELGRRQLECDHGQT